MILPFIPYERLLPSDNSNGFSAVLCQILTAWTDNHTPFSLIQPSLWSKNTLTIILYNGTLCGSDSSKDDNFVCVSVAQAEL